MGEEGIEITLAEPVGDLPVMTLIIEPVTIVVGLLAVNAGILFAVALWWVMSR